jgi:hypothetical protein
MSSLPAVWVVVIFLLPAAAVLALYGGGAWIRRRGGCGGPSDWPHRLLAFAVRLMPEDRREWGAAMLAELDAVGGSLRRWRFATGCVRVTLFPPTSARWPRACLDSVRRLSPGYEALSVLLPLSGLPLLCVATIVIGRLEQLHNARGPTPLLETHVGVAVWAAVVLIASGLPLGVAGLVRRQRGRWLPLTGSVLSVTIFPYLFVASLLVERPGPCAAADDSRSGPAQREAVGAGDVPTDPAPREAVGAVLRLFETKQIVALSDLHGCSQELTFLERMVTTPRFLAAVNVLTWEFGNSRFQPLMDDYVVNGAEVPIADLRKCWRENTQANLLGDTPRLVQLLAAIRDANRSIEEGKRLRVLLVDPPVDWAKVRDHTDVRRDLFDRDAHIAKVLEEEVYAKGLKALFFAGPAHLERRRQGAGGAATGPSTAKVPGDAPGVTALDRLEARHPGTVATIWVHVAPPDENSKMAAAMSTWPKPSVALIRGTWYETLRQPALMKRRPPSLIAGKQPQGGETPPPPPKGDGAVPADGAGLRNWDAVLYLGARDELTRVPKPGKVQVEAGWVAELRRRQRLLRMPEDDLFRPDAEEPYFPPPPPKR